MMLQYNQSTERVKTFNYLGMWLDERITWKHHLVHIETKSKKGAKSNEDDHWSMLGRRQTVSDV